MPGCRYSKSESPKSASLAIRQSRLSARGPGITSNIREKFRSASPAICVFTTALPGFHTLAFLPIDQSLLSPINRNLSIPIETSLSESKSFRIQLEPYFLIQDQHFCDPDPDSNSDRLADSDRSMTHTRLLTVL